MGWRSDARAEAAAARTHARSARREAGLARKLAAKTWDPYLVKSFYDTAREHDQGAELHDRHADRLEAIVRGDCL